MRLVSASAGARAGAVPRRAAPRWRLAGAAPPQRAARATVRARRDDEATSSPGDPNERLREELRRSLRAEADTSDPPRDGTEAVTRERRERDAGSAGGGASRRYAITVREREIFRYTLPDFFPDFNETPLEARRGAGLDDDLSTASTASGKARGGPPDDAKKNRNRPYVWRRGVLAGVERSDPLDVIARERERFERALTAETEKTETRDGDVPMRSASASESARSSRDARDARDDRDVLTHSPSASGSKLASGQNSKRRTIPPPPRREGAELGAEELGLVSKVLLGLTLFFYLVALVATTSRAFLGDSQPAPIPPEGGALPSRAPAAVPDSIRGTRAGEMWREKLGGTGGNARDEP